MRLWGMRNDRHMALRISVKWEKGTPQTEWGRRRALSKALDAYGKEFGVLSDEEVDRLVAEAHEASRAYNPS